MLLVAGDIILILNVSREVTPWPVVDACQRFGETSYPLTVPVQRTSRPRIPYYYCFVWLRQYGVKFITFSSSWANQMVLLWVSAAFWRKTVKSPLLLNLSNFIVTFWSQRKLTWTICIEVMWENCTSNVVSSQEGGRRGMAEITLSDAYNWYYNQVVAVRSFCISLKKRNGRTHYAA